MREGISLEAQRDKIAMYCELNNIELIKVITDAGISAKNMKREGLQELLALIKKKEIDAVIVYKLDRLSRSVKDTLHLIESFEKAKVAFHSVFDRIDTHTATGRFFLNIMASLAQMERELIGERTRDALQMKRSKGELVGSVPYGYVLHADGKTLIEDPEGQDAVSLARDLREQGYTFRRICIELEARGHRARMGRWHPQTVKNILKKMA